jgi:hypothetical protein
MQPTRFDYLHDPLPSFVERLRAVRVPGRLYAPLVIGGAVAAIVGAADGIESLRQRAALALEARAQVRLQATQTALRRMRLEWQQVDELVARDRRLRAIRLSGSTAATAIAAMGNAFPRGAWLTSAAMKPSSGFELKGRAENIVSLEAAVRELSKIRSGSPLGGVRFSREGREQLAELDFELELGGSR